MFGAELMKKIIEEVLQVEKAGEKMIEQARTEASRIKNDADKEMSERIDKAKEQARQIYQAELDEAKKEAQNLANKKIEQADVEKETLLKNNAEQIKSLVENICEIILKTEYDADTQ